MSLELDFKNSYYISQGPNVLRNCQMKWFVTHVHLYKVAIMLYTLQR